MYDKIDLQDSVDILYNWCVANDLQFNIRKYKLITFSRSRIFVIGSYFINDIQLEIVETLRDLSFIFDRKMNSEYHIENNINKY